MLGWTSRASMAESPTTQELDWPCWRGPTRDGMFAGSLPKSLTQFKSDWSITLDDSYSGAVVVGDRVYVTETVNKSDETLIAVSRASGEVIWKKQWQGAITVPFFAKSNGDWIRSTPATNGKQIVVGGMRDVIACFDCETGQESWRIDFHEQTGVELPAFGLVCSPLIDGDYVYVQAGGGVRQIRLSDGNLGWLALKETGGMMGGAFSSPVIQTIAGVRQLVVATRDALAGIDLESGALLWQREIKTFRGMNILTPTVWENQVFSSSYGGRSELIRLSPAADSNWGTETVWQGKSEAYMSSPIVIGNHAYLHLKNQRVCCVDLVSGEETWRTQPFGKYWSMVSDGERILALDEVGKLYLLAANPTEFELLDELEVSDSPCWAHLAVTPQDIFIRTQKGLKRYLA